MLPEILLISAAICGQLSLGGSSSKANTEEKAPANSEAPSASTSTATSASKPGRPVKSDHLERLPVKIKDLVIAMSERHRPPAASTQTQRIAAGRSPDGTTFYRDIVVETDLSKYLRAKHEQEFAKEKAKRVAKALSDFSKGMQTMYASDPEACVEVLGDMKGIEVATTTSYQAGMVRLREFEKKWQARPPRTLVTPPAMMGMQSGLAVVPDTESILDFSVGAIDQTRDRVSMVIEARKKISRNSLSVSYYDKDGIKIGQKYCTNLAADIGEKFRLDLEDVPSEVAKVVIHDRHNR